MDANGDLLAANPGRHTSALWSSRNGVPCLPAGARWRSLFATVVERFREVGEECVRKQRRCRACCRRARCGGTRP